MNKLFDIIKGLFHFRCKNETVLLFTGPLKLYKQNTGIIFLPVNICTKCGKLNYVDLNPEYYGEDMPTDLSLISTRAMCINLQNSNIKVKQPILSEKAISELRPYYINDLFRLDPRAKPIPEQEDFLTITHELY